MTGRPIFDYPPERRASDGEGCPTCGIVLEDDVVLGFCSPECAEWEDRCQSCQRGQTWCACPPEDNHAPTTPFERPARNAELLNFIAHASAGALGTPDDHANAIETLQEIRKAAQDGELPEWWGR